MSRVDAFVVVAELANGHGRKYLRLSDRNAIRDVIDDLSAANARRRRCEADLRRLSAESDSHRHMIEAMKERNAELLVRLEETEEEREEARRKLQEMLDKRAPLPA